MGRGMREKEICGLKPSNVQLIHKVNHRRWRCPEKTRGWETGKMSRTKKKKVCKEGGKLSTYTWILPIKHIYARLRVLSLKGAAVGVPLWGSKFLFLHFETRSLQLIARILITSFHWPSSIQWVFLNFRTRAFSDCTRNVEHRWRTGVKRPVKCVALQFILRADQRRLVALAVVDLEAKMFWNYGNTSQQWLQASQTPRTSSHFVLLSQ